MPIELKRYQTSLSINFVMNHKINQFCKEAPIHYLPTLEVVYIHSDSLNQLNRR